jgi:hypothetical protein
LWSWDVAKVTTMCYCYYKKDSSSTTCDLCHYTFRSTTSLTTCNKRKIADAWKSSAVFVATTYNTDWVADKCTVRLE